MKRVKNKSRYMRIVSRIQIFLFLFMTAFGQTPLIAHAAQNEQPSSAWFQNFESPGKDGKNGLAAVGSSSKAEISSVNTANSNSKNSVKLTCTNPPDSGQAWDDDIYGFKVTPQDDVKISGTEYYDASNYNYFIFNVYDGAEDNVNIVFKDNKGEIWSPNTSQIKSVKNTWTKMAIPLDKSVNKNFDFSKIATIQLGEYWGWNNVYIFDELYFAKMDTDNSPNYVPDGDNPVTTTNTALFNDFENGDGYKSGSGVTASSDSDCANVNELKSVKVGAKASGDPNSMGNYIDVTPKIGSILNTTGHDFLVFYVKDTQGNNSFNITISDSKGANWNGWTTNSSSKGKWSRMTVPLAAVTGLDFTKISKIRLGVWNAGTYYFDDVFFAKYADDVLPGFQTPTESIGPNWYQNFEVKGADSKFGFGAGQGANVSIETGFSANTFNSRSAKLVVSSASTDSIIVKPQTLAPSLDKAKPYDYSLYFDATNFSHLVFYAYDKVLSGQDLNVNITDMNDKVWSFKTSDFSNQKTALNTWKKFVIPLDKVNNPIDFSKIKNISIGMPSAGTYYVDEFYFAKDDKSNFPNLGYTEFNLNNVNGEIVPYEKGIPLASFEKQKDRNYISLDGTWNKKRVALDPNISAAPIDSARKAALEKEADNRFKTDYDDSSWTAKSLPMPEDEMCDYEAITGPEGKADKSGYQSGVWYRKHFNVGSEMEGKNVKLSFLGVNYFADVWINGTYVGGHQGGYTPFAFDVSTLLNYDSDNIIAVRVDNVKWNTFGNGEMLPYSTSDWFNYTGILRDCYLEASSTNYVVRSDIKTLDTAKGTIEVKTVLNNKENSNKDVVLSYSVFETKITDTNKTSEIAKDLIDGAAKVTTDKHIVVDASSPAVDKFNIDIANPKLWSPKNPNLYVLKVEEKIDGKVVDTFYTQFGLRTLTTDGVKIMLNGQLAPFLTGVGYTEDSSNKGPSLDNSTRYSDLQKIKEDLKANFVRTGHFPHSINSYEYTDRIGLAVWQEIPAYWFSADAFNLQGQRGQDKQMLSEMIYSNYNRPSVWFNGTCNESGGQLERVNYITQLRETAHEIDGTRLIGQSSVANPYEGKSDSSHSAADVIGMTMYFGAFYGNNADVDTQAELEDISKLNPNKPIIATEYGYWSGDEGPDDTKQAKIFTSTFNAFARVATVKEDGTPNADGLFSGGAWWTAYNWYTNITGLQTMGLYHMDRTKKKQVTDILAERYNRYNNISQGTTPKPTGIVDWFQSFESGKGFVASDSSLILSSDTESPKGNGQKGLKIIANDAVQSASYVSIVPQGSSIIKDASAFNYLNFYIKDPVGNNSNVKVTLVDADAKIWDTTAIGNTIKDTWTKLSVPLADMQGVRLDQRKLNSLAIAEVRIGISSPGIIYLDDMYMSTYKSDFEPQSFSVGKSGWFQSFEAEGTSVTAGTDATATINNYGVNPNGKKSVKLDVATTGSPGADGHCVKITPQGSASVIDASNFNYLCFYVKDTQGSNTVDVTFVDAYGSVSTDIWTSATSSVKNQWTKMYVSLDSVSVDLRQIKEIRLAEWNAGTFYIDDLYFSESPADEIPNSYTDEIPVKPIPEGLIKVACVGDSITAGSGMVSPGVTSYPAQLQSLLGSDKYLVKNFGIGGRTLLKSGDAPYWNETVFTSSKNFNPDIVIIQLGTNDTKQGNWNNGTNKFLEDYTELINTYKNLPSHPKVYVNLPPTVYNNDPALGYGILSSIMQGNIIPLIKKAAEATGVVVIDVNSATKDMPENFVDLIHPNTKGAGIIANTVANVVKGQDGLVGDTLVTKWKDNKSSAYSIVYDDGMYNSDLKFEGLNKKYKLKGTLGLINDWIDRKYNDMGASTGTWEQWKAILDRGYFDVASHSYFHLDLTKNSPAELDKQFEDSIAGIFNKTGYKPEALILPYNSYNDVVTGEAAKYFVDARQGGNNSGNPANTTNYYSLSSTMVDNTTSVAQLNTWLDNGIAKGNWLILTGHGCDGEGWSSPNLSVYDKHYEYLNTRISSIWNDTMANVGKYLKERQNVKVKVISSSETEVALTLTDTLDDSIYNFPLTVRTIVPYSWNSVQVIQGGNKKVLAPVMEGAVKVIYYDAIPNVGQISILPVNSGGSGSGTGLTPIVLPIVTKTDSNSNIVATLDSSKIDINKVNVIKIDEPKAESKILVQIPASSIGTGTGSFEINTKSVSLSLPTSIIASSLLSSGGTLQVSQSLMAAKDASVLLQNIPIGSKTNGKVFTFGMAVYDSNNNVVSNIHNFASGKSVAVTINLSNDDIKGMDTSKISAFYFDVTSKKWVEIVGSFDASKMTYTFNTTHFTDFTIMQKSEVNVNRLSGANRIETSIAIAKEQYTDTKPDAVVLTTANGFADALAGSGLAYKYNAPMLLVNKTVSDSQIVLDYIITSLSKDKNVYILGETGVVSKEISDYLSKQGYKVIRLGGKDQYETNQKIVDYLNITKGTSMVIATGNDFADALSISSIADIKGLPVFLNGKDALSTSVSSYITNLQPTTIYIVGGTEVLSVNIEAQIKKLNANIEIVRLGGKDRYETSMMIVDYFNLPSTTITVATGIDFPDALSGSVLAARKNSGVILVDNKDVARQKELLSKEKITNVIVFGGEGVIKSEIVTSLMQK